MILKSELLLNGAVLDEFDILTWRHGQTVLGADGRFAGSNDTPLTEKGRAEATQVAEVICHLPKEQWPQALFKTKRERTRQSAEPVKEMLAERGHRIEILTAPEFNERGLGEWEGQKKKECPAGSDQTRGQLYLTGVTPPGGQSAEAHIEQILQGLQKHETIFANKRCAISWHGGCMRALLFLCGYDDQIEEIPNGQVFHFTRRCGGQAGVEVLQLAGGKIMKTTPYAMTTGVCRL